MTGHIFCFVIDIRAFLLIFILPCDMLCLLVLYNVECQFELFDHQILLEVRILLGVSMQFSTSLNLFYISIHFVNLDPTENNQNDNFIPK